MVETKKKTKKQLLYENGPPCALEKPAPNAAPSDQSWLFLQVESRPGLVDLATPIHRPRQAHRHRRSLPRQNPRQNSKPLPRPHSHPCQTLLPHEQQVPIHHLSSQWQNLAAANTEKPTVGKVPHPESSACEVQLNEDLTGVLVPEFHQAKAASVSRIGAKYSSKSASCQPEIESCNRNTSQTYILAHTGLAQWLPKPSLHVDLRAPEDHIDATHAQAEAAGCLWLSQVWDTLGIKVWGSLPTARADPDNSHGDSAAYSIGEWCSPLKHKKHIWKELGIPLFGERRI